MPIRPNLQSNNVCNGPCDCMRGWKAFAAGGVSTLALLIAGGGGVAAALDCRERGLSRTELLICEDVQLQRTDQQLSRRADALGRRLSYGQYLGLRHWIAASARQRDLCGVDRTCVGANYRSQNRVLDRLQQCLDARIARRACLRNALGGERETMRR
jgi:uncharacterized protein